MSSTFLLPAAHILNKRFCSSDPRGPFVDLGSAKAGFDQVEPFIGIEDADKFEINWLAKDETSRSRRYQLNAWLGFSSLILSAHEKSPETETVTAQRIMRAAQDWHTKYPFNPEDPTGKTEDNPFAWYDMAVGLRASILGYLWTKSGCGAGYSDVQMTCLTELTRTHLDYLLAPSLWMSHSNHGFYQSAGLLSLVTQASSAISNADEHRELAVSRIKHYIDGTVTESGVHKEHSPLYHSFLFTSVAALSPWLNAESSTELAVINLFERLQFAKAAMFLPNGLMLPFGDSRFATPSDRLRLSEKALSQLSPDLRNIMPDRQDVPIDQFLPALDAGLSIHKKRGEGSSHYFAMTAAYHGSVHKTLDDMSVFWAENDVPILTDPGYYGYSGKTEIGSEQRKQGFYYADPKRIYVESAHAHNTVEIDGHSEPRHPRLQYGSALIAAGRGEAGWICFEADRVRPSHVHHNRIVLNLPGKTLLVLDKLSDLKGRKRDFVQWFQLFPSWKLSKSDDGFIGFFNENWLEEHLTGDVKIDRHVKKVAGAIGQTEKRLSILHAGSVGVSTEAHQGETEPRFQGWTSLAPDSFTPAPALSVRPSDPQSDVLIATLIHHDDPSIKVSNFKLLTLSHTSVELTWEEQSDDIRVNIDRQNDHIRVAVNGKPVLDLVETRSQQCDSVDRAIRHQAETGAWPTEAGALKRTFVRRAGAKALRMVRGSK